MTCETNDRHLAAELGPPRSGLIAGPLPRRPRPAPRQSNRAGGGVYPGPGSHRGGGGATAPSTPLPASATPRRPPAGTEPAGVLRTAYHHAAHLSELLAVRARLVSTQPGPWTTSPRPFGDRYRGRREFRRRLQTLTDRGRGLIAADTVSPRPSPAGKRHHRPAAARPSSAPTRCWTFGKLMFLTRKPGVATRPAAELAEQLQHRRQRVRFEHQRALPGAARRSALRDLPLQECVCRRLVLSFDGKRVLFSMPAEPRTGAWKCGRSAPTARACGWSPRTRPTDYDNYGRLLPAQREHHVMSSRCYQAVPCTGGDQSRAAVPDGQRGPGGGPPAHVRQDHSLEPRSASTTADHLTRAGVQRPAALLQPPAVSA